MIKVVTKRDGRKEEFSPSKLNQWGEWAAKTLGGYVDWPSIVLQTVSTLPEECTSTVLQERLIKTCLDMDSWSYNRMAGRLYAALINKSVFGKNIPTVKELHHTLAAKGFMTVLDYSDEEYAEVEKIINHKLDYKATHFELHQTRSKYALKNRVTGEEFETQQFTYMRMAMALAESQPQGRRMEDLSKWYEHLSQKRLNAPTPNYVNLGTSLRGYASCCLFTTNDTAKSIETGVHIAYTMTTMSAGIGAHFNIRSIGEAVRGGVIEHQGKLPYYRYLVSAVHSSLQNGRGGACTMHYTAYDPEVVVISQLKNPMSTEDKKIRGMDYSFGSNKFFARKVAKGEDVFLFNGTSAPDLHAALYSSDPDLFGEIYAKYERDKKFEKKYVSARDIAITVLNEGYETGRAYLHFPDEMNKHTPFKETIYSSNLCVAPETLVLTKSGYVPIVDLKDSLVDVWNGTEWSNVLVKKTGENQKLLRVVTNNGYEIECTPYHKFYVFNGYGKPYVEKRATELQVGDKLCKFDLPTIVGGNALENAYLNGFYSGDGCEYKGKSIIYLYGEKRSLSTLILGHEVTYHIVQEEQDREVFHVGGLRSKFFVPSSNFTVDARLEWLAGWLDADGCIYRNGDNEAITGSSVELGFLKSVQLMLQTLGVSSKVNKVSSEGYKMLPKNDRTGENGEFWCRDAYRLLISSCDSHKLLEMGLGKYLKRLKVVKRMPQRDAKQFVKIDSVLDEGRLDDTYCLNEPKKHMVMFNGILTGQCQEISIPTQGYDSMSDLYSIEDHGKGEIGLCSLAGVCVDNIESDEQYAEVMYYALLMIDKCIHMSEYILPHLGVTAKARLSAGVGIIGLAHLMAKNKVTYSSQEGKNFIHELSESHMYHAVQASLRLGKELGVAPWMHKTKWPEGWMPIDTYNKNVDAVVTVQNKRDWDKLRREVIDAGGIRNSVLVAHMPSESSSKASGTTNGVYPVRDITLLKGDNTTMTYWAAPNGEKLNKWYERSWDIETKDLIDVYAILQKFTDQAISADLYRKLIGDDVVTTSEMLTDYLYMVKMGMKTRYYVNSKTSDGTSLGDDGSIFNTVADDETECESCTL